MLVFKSDDKKLLIWINGNTKAPDTLTQDELAQLKENGDPRVEEVPDTATTKGKTPKVEAPKPEDA